jgi:tetratricopeptide (TPR) repeat protein
MAFVGREDELDRLAREMALALELSVGRAIFVEGSAGTGKTALVAEFLARTTAQRSDVAIARGRCLQTFGSADPYLPFIEAIRDLSDDEATGSIKSEKVSELLAELAPYWLSVVPVVGNLLSATFATAARLKGQSMGAAPSREALFVQYLELIKKLAAQAPLVLVLDDLHWADQSSVALLAHLSRGTANLPVLIVGTLRRTEAELEKHPVIDLIRELEREDSARRIPLGDLDGKRVGALLKAEFGGEVAEPLTRWVVQTAGGNPLFLSELARLMKENGAAVVENGEWHLTAAVEGLEVPRSAEAVIESRIQHLDPEEVKLLQYASVEGIDFNSTVVARLLEQDELEVLDTLEKMERRYRLVKTVGEIELPDGDIATTYSFPSALTQTVLYKQVVGKRRILLHRRAAETIESIFPDSLDEVAGKLARHFHQGRVKESAHRYARQAADRARLIYAHWEAEELFRVALENSPDDETRADLEERLGDVYGAVGYYQKGVGCYESSLAKRTADDAGALRLRRKMVVLERKAGLAPAPVLLQRIRALIAAATDHPREHCLLLLESVTEMPDAVGTQDTVRKALQIAESAGDEPLILRVLERLAYVIIFYSDDVGEALPYLRRAKEIIGQLGDPLRMEQCRTLTAILHARLGQYEDAATEFQAVVEIAERVGKPHSIGVAYNNLGALLMRMGRYSQAQAALQQAYEIHLRRDRSMLVSSLQNLAETERRSGEPNAAVEHYREMVVHARTFEYWTAEAVAHAGLSLCLLEVGRIAEAREAADQAMSAIADREEWFEDREFVEILLARLAEMDGHVAAALVRLEKAAENVAGYDVYAWARVELERARMLVAGDPESAQSTLERVLERTAGFPDGFAPEIEALQKRLASASPAASNAGFPA